MPVDQTADLRRDETRDQEADGCAADDETEGPAGVLQDRRREHCREIERRPPAQDLRDAEDSDDDPAVGA